MRAELYDAGTRLLKGTYGGGGLLDVQARPGMDFGSFREIDFEYDASDQAVRAEIINRKILTEALRTTLAPWPKPFPGRMWVDDTTRYEADVGGPVLTCYVVDPYNGDRDQQVPGARTELVETDRREEVRRIDARVSTLPTVSRIQAVNSSPTEWLRLDLENESAGTTDLREPLVVMHHTDKEGGMVTLACDYNTIIAPFDLRQPSWYRVVNDNHEVIASAPEDVARLCTFDPEGHYRLYLRPARWRMVMTVVAHYLYVSLFETFPVDQYFTQAYYDRPPVFPKRHNVLHPTYAYEVNGVLHAYDEAMNIQFEQSRASGKLAFFIIDAQWHTMCEAFIYLSNDPGSLVATLYPPANDDVVLGIGRVDYPGGAEEVVWVKQSGNGESLNSAWVPTTIETFYVPWFVTPDFGM